MFIIKDGFYANPDQVREWALQQEFKVSGNYPGLRTDVYPDPFFTNVKKEIEKIIHKKITNWPTTYNTAFQITTKDSHTWVHYDPTNWAAVCYMTPDAPRNTGTAIFRHKKTGKYKYEEGDTDWNDRKNKHVWEDWEQLDYCANIYNRLVIYHGAFYHSSAIAGFGNGIEDGRLFQTFFFDTED